MKSHCFLSLPTPPTSFSIFSMLRRSILVNCRGGFKTAAFLNCALAIFRISFKKSLSPLHYLLFKSYSIGRGNISSISCLFKSDRSFPRQNPFLWLSYYQKEMGVFHCGRRGKKSLDPAIFTQDGISAHFSILTGWKGAGARPVHHLGPT